MQDHQGHLAMAALDPLGPLAPRAMMAGMDALGHQVDFVSWAPHRYCNSEDCGMLTQIASSCMSSAYCPLAGTYIDAFTISTIASLNTQPWRL
jgi:hypothetical protein